MRTLPKEWDAAFRSGDKQAYSEAQGKLRRVTRDAKPEYNNNPRSMWNGIKALTDYKAINLLPWDDVKLPDVLNQFFARFNTQLGGGGWGSAPLINQPVRKSTLVLQHHQVRTTLKKINTTKAAGPDGVLAGY